MTRIFGRLKTSGIVFEPKSSSQSSEGELYVDSGSAQLSVKSSGEDTTPIGAAPASSTNPLLKTMQNKSGTTIPDKATICKLSNGGVAEASSDIAGKMGVIGVARGEILDEAQGTVGLFGPNHPGVLDGLGFTPGQKVYMAESLGQYTTDLGSFSGGDDRIVRMGIADCASGDASEEATDLLCILTEEVADNV